MEEWGSGWAGRVSSFKQAEGHQFPVRGASEMNKHVDKRLLGLQGKQWGVKLVGT